MRFAQRLLAVVLALLVLPVGVLVADPQFLGIPIQIYEGVGAIVALVVSFFSIRAMNRALAAQLMTGEDINKYISKILASMGVPIDLAQAISEVIANLAVSLPTEAVVSVGMSVTQVDDSKVLDAVKGVVVQAAANLSPSEAKTLVPGLPEKAYLVRENRVLVADRLVNDPMVIDLIRSHLAQHIITR